MFSILKLFLQMLSHPNAEDYDFDEFKRTQSEFAFIKIIAFPGKRFNHLPLKEGLAFYFTNLNPTYLVMHRAKFR